MHLNKVYAAEQQQSATEIGNVQTVTKNAVFLGVFLSLYLRVTIMKNNCKFHIVDTLNEI